jgi:hypothetical protein
VSRANEWLRRNGQVRVKTAESIEVKGRLDGVTDTNKSCYFEADHTRRKMRNMYIRALRLWVIPKDESEPPEPQQIAYVNIVPARSEFGVFDSFGDTVRKFNLHLRSRPIPGEQIARRWQSCPMNQSDPIAHPMRIRSYLAKAYLNHWSLQVAS